MAKFAILLAACLCATLCATLGAALDADRIGYDNHKDKFYFDDGKVALEYARVKYTNTLVQMGGQEPDKLGHLQADSPYPFAVGMKTVEKSGSTLDRWDVRSLSPEIELFALFHGTSGFVVNKLRAQLLRKLGNAIESTLVELDATEVEKKLETVKSYIKDSIQQIFRDLDNELRKHMKDNDDSSASASVVIVTKKYLITANVGKGKILVRGSVGDVHNFGADSIQEDPSNPSEMNLFGLRKSKAGLCKPHVEINERYYKTSIPNPFADDEGEEEEQSAFIETDTKSTVVVIETPEVATNILDNHVFHNVMSMVSKHSGKEGYEQAFYQDAVTGILSDATSKLTWIPWLKPKDFAVMVIGLERDLSEIH